MSQQWLAQGLAALTVAALAAGPAVAQDILTGDVLYSYTGVTTNNGLGLVVGGAGDADGDGRSDFVVGSSDRLDVYSGLKGLLLWQKHGDFNFDWEDAVAMPIRDIDGDTRDEIVVGAPFANRDGQPRCGGVFLFSGATGNRLWALRGQTTGDRFGASVAVIGDVDGDGVPDLVAGAPGMTGLGQDQRGEVALISGKTGQIRAFMGLGVPVAAGAHLGTAVAPIGDVDGDGVGDFAVSAPDASPSGRTHAGVVYFLSGRDGHPLDHFDGPEANMRLGASLASAGDVKGDGRLGLIIGAPGRAVNGQAGAGTVYVRANLPFQSTLFRLEGVGAGDGFGTTVAGGGDVDGDGRPDILVGSPHATVDGHPDTGLVQVFSGVDGQELLHIRGIPGSRLGTAVAYCGDVNGDQWTDIVIGAPGMNGFTAEGIGIAVVVSLPGI
jgi:FG-GAP repeat